MQVVIFRDTVYTSLFAAIGRCRFAIVSQMQSAWGSSTAVSYDECQRYSCPDSLSLEALRQVQVIRHIKFSRRQSQVSLRINPMTPADSVRAKRDILWRHNVEPE